MLSSVSVFFFNSFFKDFGIGAYLKSGLSPGNFWRILLIDFKTWLQKYLKLHYEKY